jgi:hypothetical protein
MHRIVNFVYKNPNLEIFLFCQRNSTGGGNLELRQTILLKSVIWPTPAKNHCYALGRLVSEVVKYQVKIFLKNQFSFL